MASINYTSFFRDQAKGDIDLDTDTFRMMLVTSSYTPNKDHAKRSDITNEVTGPGYTAGGAVVTLTPTLDTTNDRLDIAVGSVNWPSSTISAAYGIIYKARGGAASADELVACLDFGGTITSTNGPFTVTPSSPLRIQN